LLLNQPPLSLLLNKPPFLSLNRAPSLLLNNPPSPSLRLNKPPHRGCDAAGGGDSGGGSGGDEADWAIIAAVLKDTGAEEVEKACWNTAVPCLPVSSVGAAMAGSLNRSAMAGSLGGSATAASVGRSQSQNGCPQGRVLQ
jgi:hypothetical protein